MRTNLLKVSKSNLRLRRKRRRNHSKKMKRMRPIVTLMIGMESVETVTGKIRMIKTKRMKTTTMVQAGES